MGKKIKFIIIVFCAVLICSCNSNKSDQDKTTSGDKSKTIQTDPKDQYRMVEDFQDDKDQMIDLIEGKATFDISYQGEGNFNAVILTTDGKQIDQLANVNGNYKATKTIQVPQTTGYILRVRCKGTWSIYRK